MKNFFLSIGSNVEPERNIPACLRLLKERFAVKNISSVYESDPVGPRGGRKFWNLTVEIETVLNAQALRAELRKMEEALGRKRNPADKFAPRTIDIDILPQGNYQKLAFIMTPLAEIAPDVKDEETGKSWKEISVGLKDSSKALRKLH